MVDEERLVMEDRQRQILDTRGTPDEKRSRSKKNSMQEDYVGQFVVHSSIVRRMRKKASEEAVQTQVPTIQETTTQAADSAPPQILIQSDEEKRKMRKNYLNISFQKKEKKKME